MYICIAQLNSMKKQRKNTPVLSFKKAIELALHTPKLTHKQLDELRKKGLLKR
jgi:hypothetical protein